MLAPSRSVPSGLAGRPAHLPGRPSPLKGPACARPGAGPPRTQRTASPCAGSGALRLPRLSLRKFGAHACATREPRQGSADGLGCATLSRHSHRYGVSPQRPAARPGELNTLQTPHGVRGTARNSPGRAGWPGLWRGRGRQWRRRCRRGFDELMAPAAPVRTDERGCRNLPARGKEHAKMVRLEVVVCTAFMFACAIDRRAEQVQNTGMG